MFGINLGDVHFNVPSVPVGDLITAFKQLLIDIVIRDRKPVNMLNIAGDITDRQIHFGREQGFEILSFFIWLCKFCEDNKIILNVLEGTPSHDWRQARVLEVFAKEHKSLVFNYFCDLTVWFHQGVSFLYIPDEWSGDSQTTLKAIHKLLAEHQLSRVDVVVMHGQFEYQLPEIALSKKTFLSDLFLPMVRHAVLINHIHTHKPLGKIIPPGSLGRYRHGEEEPKGLVYWSLENDQFNWEFIENTQATIFKTIKLPMDLDKSLAKITTLVNEHPKGSHFRFDVKKGHPVRKILSELMIRHPTYHFSDIISDEDKPQALKAVEDLPATEINEQNYLVFLDHYLINKVPANRIDAVKARIKAL